MLAASLTPQLDRALPSEGNSRSGAGPRGSGLPFRDRLAKRTVSLIAAALLLAACSPPLPADPRAEQILKTDHGMGEVEILGPFGWSWHAAWLGMIGPCQSRGWQYATRFRAHYAGWDWRRVEGHICTGHPDLRLAHRHSLEIRTAP